MSSDNVTTVELIRRRAQLRKDLTRRALGAALPLPANNCSIVKPIEVAVVASTSKTDLQSEQQHVDEEEKVVVDDYYKVLQADKREYQDVVSSFLKGTQSANPHNDLCQHFVDTGQLPANFIRDAGVRQRFAEYPKWRDLIERKDAIVASTATTPMFLRVPDMHTFELRSLAARFDVIIIEPPLVEYGDCMNLTDKRPWTWDEIEQLDIPSIADQRCFLWIWCGASPTGTARARQCLQRWQFRRCEDIVWVKRNTHAQRLAMTTDLADGSLFQRAKEHCLMGIKGTVRRATDGDFIHANVDIDIIVAEARRSGDCSHPKEIFTLAEHFCLGRRRLHLFARDETLRSGWLSVGPALTSSNYAPKIYNRCFERAPGKTTGTTRIIENLRPKSPDRGPMRRPPLRRRDDRDRPRAAPVETHGRTLAKRLVKNAKVSISARHEFEPDGSPRKRHEIDELARNNMKKSILNALGLKRNHSPSSQPANKRERKRERRLQQQQNPPDPTVNNPNMDELGERHPSSSSSTTQDQATISS